jgi:8-oxo-dGTP pyrophosphatase MutT (NUDIX family)
VREYTIGVALSEDHVVLVRKNRPAWQAGRINFPGGKMELGETPEQCIARKFAEETGVFTNVSMWDRVGVMYGENTANHEDGWKVHILRAESFLFDGVRTMEDEEVILVDRDRFLVDPDLLSSYIGNLPAIYAFATSDDHTVQGATLCIDYPRFNG